MHEPEPTTALRLLDLIRAEIRTSGPLTFARFMERALYEPGLGYYARGADRIGSGGDYFTAASVAGVFGASVARLMSELDAGLDHPASFEYVEFGCGRGHLARDVLDALAREDPQLSARTRIALVDRSAAMRAEAAERVPEADVAADPPLRGGAGLVIAVELLDALPVHRLRRRAGVLREVFVGVDPRGELTESESDPTPDARHLAERYGAAPDEGDEAEVCPAAATTIERLASAIDRGFLVLVDYGAKAAELYHPSRRRGTLLAYHGHGTNEDYFARVGEQDLTAHVNWSLVEDQALALGLAIVGATTQDRFLIQTGALRAFQDEDPAAWRRVDRVKERLRVMQLVHPSGMGRAFQVFVLGKGLGSVPRPTCLADPFD